MGEKRTGKRWGPQHPHKHPPPTMLVQIWGRSSPFPAARDQPKTRGRSQGSHHFPDELVVLIKSAQNRSNPPQERGKDTHGMRLLCKGLLPFWFCPSGHNFGSRRTGGPSSQCWEAAGARSTGGSQDRTNIFPGQPGANRDPVQGLALLPAAPQAGWKGGAESSPPGRSPGGR